MEQFNVDNIKMTNREFLNSFGLTIEEDNGWYEVVDRNGGIIGSGSTKADAVREARENMNI